MRRALLQGMQRRLGGLSAEMAYNAMLALFPTIMATIAAIALFEESLQSTVLQLIGRFTVEDNSSLRLTFDDLAAQIRLVAPDMAWELLKNVVTEITQARNLSLFSVSFLAAIWIASSAIGAAMNALDQIQRIPSKYRRPFWKARLIAVLLALGSIVLLVTASFLVLLGDVTVKFVVNLIKNIPELLQTLPGVSATSIQFGEIRTLMNQADLLLDLWRLLGWPVALGIVSVAFAFIYRYGPSRRIRGTPIFPGAILAALSWAGISALFRLYVNNFGNYNRVYGTVGAAIVLMLWLYMSSFVMLLGAQLNTTVGQQMLERQGKKAINFIRARDREVNIRS
ncbi:MAG: YihY/virulence factor BrkB family protein [Cyanobacteriota bacterium]|nr:YihY/virulence factor BrkB family protein [Cyanobacteriota bacterium]